MGGKHWNSTQFSQCLENLTDIQSTGYIVENVRKSVACSVLCSERYV